MFSQRPDATLFKFEHLTSFLSSLDHKIEFDATIMMTRRKPRVDFRFKKFGPYGAVSGVPGE